MATRATYKGWSVEVSHDLETGIVRAWVKTRTGFILGFGRGYTEADAMRKALTDCAGRSAHLAAVATQLGKHLGLRVVAPYGWGRLAA